MNTGILLRLLNIRKTFPGVQALKNASLELREGEIHALVGENGAGKSTLIKVLTGAHEPDAGGIFIRGTHVSSLTLKQARSSGIAAIYQEYTLVPLLSVRDNLFLGRERKRFGALDLKLECDLAQKALRRLGSDIDVETRVSSLSVAQQQMVEIARALLVEAKILVMDEPTAALSPMEVENLFNVLRELVPQGVGIIFISHRLDEVFAIADRITVIRDGETIDTRRVSEYSRATVIEQMVGRTIEDEFPRGDRDRGRACLTVDRLSGGGIADISFEVRAGEVYGIAGLMGSGRTQLARLLFGVDRKSTGAITLNGQPITINSPADAIMNGICLLTEDRKSQGLILKASVLENFALPNLTRWSKRSWIDLKSEKHRFLERSRELRVRFSHPDQKAEHLSGGNQQKLLVARWLETDSIVFIFDEPTRGIDVGAKYDVYLLINKLAAEGKSDYRYLIRFAGAVWYL